MPYFLMIRRAGTRALLGGTLIAATAQPSPAYAQTPPSRLVDLAFQTQGSKQPKAPKPSKPKKQKTDKLKWDFKDHPSLKYGKKFSLDFRLRIQEDKRSSAAQ